MTMSDSCKPSGSDSSGKGDMDKVQQLNQRHVLRYIAELTEEMSRLASAHECVELADDLSAVAKKARKEMIDRS